VIYPEGVFYGNVAETDVTEIVNEHLVGGRPVERLRLRFPQRNIPNGTV
jgi:(2Fe-2S) ferredoxin